MRALVESENHDLRSALLRWPEDRGEPRRDRDLLRASGVVSDDPAADSPVEFRAPEFAAAQRIDCVEVAAHVAEKDQLPAGGGYAAHNGIIRLGSPFPLAAVGVGGIEPAGPIGVGILLSGDVQRVDLDVPHPNAAVRYRFDLAGAL